MKREMEKSVADCFASGLRMNMHGDVYITEYYKRMLVMLPNPETTGDMTFREK